MNTSYQSVGVFIDGGYYAKINQALEQSCSANINVSALMSFIRNEVSRISGSPLMDCHITENHFFRGRYRVHDANDKHLLFSERKFEDALIENDVIFHYKHLRTNDEGGIIEKGVDTWFALDTYEMTLFREFDFVVLISGDADHEMLARKLKALKTHVILLTWDPANTASTSRFLKEEVCTHIDMNKIIAEDKTLLQTLTTV
jgi:uncharacterized LabA/DUF88 family protein